MGSSTTREGLALKCRGLTEDAITWELTGNLQRLRNSYDKVSLAAEVLEITKTACPDQIGRILSIGAEERSLANEKNPQT